MGINGNDREKNYSIRISRVALACLGSNNQRSVTATAIAINISFNLDAEDDDDHDNDHDGDDDDVDDHDDKRHSQSGSN